MTVWVLLSISAGFCEEFVFRGYLQKQFFALTGSDAAAIAGQALIFGVAHGYQGVKGMITHCDLWRAVRHPRQHAEEPAAWHDSAHDAGFFGGNFAEPAIEVPS